MNTATNPPVASDALLECPFCGAVPEFYDGLYRVRHTTRCYLYDGQEYHWILGVVGAAAWDYRHSNPTGQVDNEDNLLNDLRTGSKT